MRWIAAALICTLFGAPVWADQIHLTNGKVLEGTAKFVGKDVVVKTSSGIEARFPKARVLKIVKGKTKVQVFQDRLAKLDAKSLRAHKALVAWCLEKKLRRQAKQVRRTIIERFPNDAETRVALDYVRYKGKWITRDAFMRGLGLVKTGRSWVTREEAARRAKEKELKAKQKEVRKLLRRVALDGRKAVAAKLKDYSDLAALPPLTKKGLRSGTVATRRLAIAELSRRKARSSELALARLAVVDTKRAVRKEALDALVKVGAKRAPHYFVSALSSSNLFQRVHALHGISYFPTARAIPAMIHKLRESTGGWGRASLSIITQRAYIQDYELSSGGTGLVVAEVADPVIGTSTTGVVLETKVKGWYRETLVTVLQRVSGQNFGKNPKAWQNWWKKSGKGFTPKKK